MTDLRNEFDALADKVIETLKTELTRYRQVITNGDSDSARFHFVNSEIWEDTEIIGIHPDGTVRREGLNEDDDSYDFNMFSDQTNWIKNNLNDFVTFAAQLKEFNMQPENLFPNPVTEITPEEYDDALESMPPIYIRKIDSIEVINAFAVSEPVSEQSGMPTFRVYFQYKGFAYSCQCMIDEVTFSSYDNQRYSKMERAFTVHPYVSPKY
jgi:hypothetical protein